MHSRQSVLGVCGPSTMDSHLHVLPFTLCDGLTVEAWNFVEATNEQPLAQVDYKRGWGQFTKEGLDVETSDGNKESLKAKNYIIATGSEVAPLKGIELDEER